ncbi:MAG: Nif3-like dinuclear metal center hexameric protein, partial [Clostridiales bacterium]|nr:Nif3-like dinuclear metal center hexameric protein [Clostridiales bacterium]
SLDCSQRAAETAKKIGANCIFTHHPAIFQAIRSLQEGDAVLECAKSGISILSAHLNLDCAEGGIDDSLMHGLGGKNAESVMHPLTTGGYGKVFTVENTPLSTFAERIKKEFKTQRIVVYGDRPVKRVASFCGAGMDGESVNFAVSQGAD